LTIKSALAPNKNAGKLVTWLLAGLQLGLLGLGAFGASLLGASILTTIFLVTIGIDLCVNLVKSIYFFIRSLTAKNKADEQFYNRKAQKAAIGLIVSGLVACALVLLLLAAPHIGLTAAAIIGIAMGVILAALALYSIGKAIIQTFFNQETNEIDTPEVNTTEQYTDSDQEQQTVGDKELAEDQSPELQITTESNEEEIEPKPSVDESTFLPVLPSPISNDYYQHAVIKNASPLEIIMAIEAQQTALSTAIEAEKTKEVVFSEIEKRENKIAALEVLKDLVTRINDKKINFNGKEVSYKFGKEDAIEEFICRTPEEFKTLFNEYIVDTFPDVYQSFYRHIGQTENLFLQAYKLLTNEKYVANQKPNKPNVVDKETGTETDTSGGSSDKKGNATSHL